MIPQVELQFKDCSGVLLEPQCGYVAVVSSELDPTGSFTTDQLVAYVNGIVDQASAVIFDEVQYNVLERKVLPATCSTKVTAYRTYPSGCSACTGQLHLATSPVACTDNSTSTTLVGSIVFSARHVNTATKAYPGGLVSHVETYEIYTESTYPINSDNYIIGCGKTYKVKQVLERDSIKLPTKIIAEVTPRPRASI